MWNNKLIQRGLMFAAAIMGASMLAMYFLGFVIGFMLNVFMVIGVVIYIQRKQSKEIGYNAERGGTMVVVAVVTGLVQNQTMSV